MRTHGPSVPYVYPGKAMAEQWLSGDEDGVKRAIHDMIEPYRLVIVGAILAELHRVCDYQCQQFMRQVLDYELETFFDPADTYKRYRR